jgi:hypothetical protein
MIGAYYYPWYTSGWLKKTPYSKNPPVLGQYCNTVYGPTITQHLAMMKNYGIDFIVVSWDPETNYEHLLDSANIDGPKICIMYESLYHLKGKHDWIDEQYEDMILKDLSNIRGDFDEKCWFKIDDKPVLFIYVSRNYKNIEFFNKVRQSIGPSFLVGDESFWQEPDPNRIEAFDALTSYNWYQPGRFSGNDKETCDSFLTNIKDYATKWNQACKDKGRQYWPVAMPGYDDRNVRPQAGHLPIPRMDGYFFERSLEDAKLLQPNVTMICTFNEHYEGTGIEPMRSYGEKYMEIFKKSKI